MPNAKFKDAVQKIKIQSEVEELREMIFSLNRALSKAIEATRSIILVQHAIKLHLGITDEDLKAAIAKSYQNSPDAVGVRPEIIAFNPSDIRAGG